MCWKVFNSFTQFLYFCELWQVAWDSVTISTVKLQIIPWLLFLFIYLAVLSLSCSMQNLIPWPGIKPWPPALGARSLSYRTSREVPVCFLLKIPSCCLFVVNNPHPHPPGLLTTTDLFSFPIIWPFPECDINEIICRLLCWAFPIQYSAFGGFPGGTNGKERTCKCRRCERLGFGPWVGKIPWRRAR